MINESRSAPGCPATRWCEAQELTLVAAISSLCHRINGNNFTVFQVPSLLSAVCSLQHCSTRHTWQDTNQMNLYDFHCSQKTCWLSKDILPGQMMESSPTCSHQSHSSLATDTCAECTAISNVELRFESITSQSRISLMKNVIFWFISCSLWPQAAWLHLNLDCN